MENEISLNTRLDLSAVQTSIQQVRAELQKVIVGQQRMIDLLIAALLANGHVLIEGVPGIAKTLSARLLARTVAVGFSRLQFTPDLMPSDVLGTAVYNMKTSDFEFKSGPIFSNMILIDEINRAPAKTQAALFEVMEERQATIDGVTYPMARPFMVIATQNPIEQEGTYRLPEAQIDRFLFKIEVDYPPLDDEIEILNRHHQRREQTPVELVNPVLNAAQLGQYQALVKTIHIEAHLVRYIAQMVQTTRAHEALYLGGSPRASLSILTAAKAFAIINGRDFVTPDDIREVIYPALQHRLLLTPEKEMEGRRIKDVIRQIIDRIEVPR